MTSRITLGDYSFRWTSFGNADADLTTQRII